MSRRSRRREGAANKSWLGKAMIALAVLAVISLVAAYAALRGYLHSDKFRKFLSAETSKVAAVTGEFAPFRWQGLAVDTERFDATGEGLVTSVRADDLHTEIGLGGIGRGVWEVRDTTLRRLDIALDARKRVDRQAVAVAEQKSDDSTSRAGWLPRDAELRQIEVREVTVRARLDQGEFTATGMSVHAEQTGAKKAYRAEIEGGTVRHPFPLVPELRLDRLRVRYQDGRVFLTESNIQAWENGRIAASGEWDAGSRKFFVEGDASGLKCDEIFGEDWAKRINGDLASDFAANNELGSPVASGGLVVTNGVLTALPMLDALAAYADTRRFRVLTLNEARTSWQWKNGELSLLNLVLSSEGLVRLEGGMTIRGRQIDGIFRLGLAPGTLSTIPGAETDVFVPGERGLMWTPLRVTGTLDDPEEDLTDRLVAAAGLRMFDKIPETGEKVIKFTRSVIGEPPAKTVEQGVKIIGEGTRVVRDVGGILGGLLGGPEEEKEPEKKEP